ncbi:hypothetical protein [Pelodictyon luteolum]|uniref:hypothetical protein n=1 Tax=Pelodictyon luteolum TaxID=1100 RepID=UPI00059E140E|nr:hypothetical protein [Pelodictyon luteolum]
MTQPVVDVMFDDNSYLQRLSIQTTTLDEKLTVVVDIEQVPLHTKDPMIMPEGQAPQHDFVYRLYLRDEGDGVSRPVLNASFFPNELIELLRLNVLQESRVEKVITEGTQLLSCEELAKALQSDVSRISVI